MLVEWRNNVMDFLPKNFGQQKILVGGEAGRPVSNMPCHAPIWQSLFLNPHNPHKKIVYDGLPPQEYHLFCSHFPNNSHFPHFPQFSPVENEDTTITAIHHYSTNPYLLCDCSKMSCFGGFWYVLMIENNIFSPPQTILPSPLITITGLVIPIVCKILMVWFKYFRHFKLYQWCLPFAWNHPFSHPSINFPIVLFPIFSLSLHFYTFYEAAVCYFKVFYTHRQLDSTWYQWRCQWNTNPWLLFFEQSLCWR